jgi:hypothetical protein
MVFYSTHIVFTKTTDVLLLFAFCHCTTLFFTTRQKQVSSLHIRLVKKEAVYKKVEKKRATNLTFSICGNFFAFECKLI